MKKYIEITWEDIINNTEIYKIYKNINRAKRIKRYKGDKNYTKYSEQLKGSYKKDIKNCINILNKNSECYKYRYMEYFNYNKDIKSAIKNSIVDFFGPYCDKSDARRYSFMREMIIPFVIWTDKELEEIDDIIADAQTSDFWDDESEGNY